MPGGDYDFDDDGKKGEGSGKRVFKEFDCPSCSANNPSEGFGDGDEILCNYCGTEYLVKVTDEGKPKFKEL